MSQTFGKTRWKRFALVMVPSIAATAAIGVGIANSALAASFAVSGQRFKVTVEQLTGEKFAQFGSFDAEVNGQIHPVAISAFDTATLKGMCQSVVTTPSLLGLKLPEVTMRLEAGKSDDPKKQVTAENLLIDLDSLRGDAEFKSINIGQDASTLDGKATDGWKSALGTGKPSGAIGFSQAAKSATLTDVKQTAYATSAGTFNLRGLSLDLYLGSNGKGKECFYEEPKAGSVLDPNAAKQ
ncbi:DUF6230 family protein [Kitasatospora sp. NPDC096147]|uniref:DUF6230 family protein n=1 Tax=Kitasatospora sp. NPDC096147 TaxID=3364093 RepID=UPI003806CB22